MLEHIQKDELTVKEVLDILKSFGITKNPQTVRSWIRGEVKGKELKSTPPPPKATKIGHRVHKKDLETFIKKHGKMDVDSFNIGNDIATKEEIQCLQAEIKQLKKENESLQKQLIEQQALKKETSLQAPNFINCNFSITLHEQNDTNSYHEDGEKI